jgi:hypothetical protein
MSKLIRFKTKYGDRVMGGYTEIVRSPSTREELNAPLAEVDQAIIDQYEKDHLKALQNLERSPFAQSSFAVNDFDYSYTAPPEVAYTQHAETWTNQTPNAHLKFIG